MLKLIEVLRALLVSGARWKSLNSGADTRRVLMTEQAALVDDFEALSSRRPLLPS